MAFVEELHSEGFRNLGASCWRPAPGRQIVVGPNGAGKTSLLEAIYVLATTRSFRTSRLAECSRHGSSATHLTAEVAGDSRSRLEMRWGDEAGRRRFLNGSSVGIAQYLEVLPVVAWSSASSEVVSGPPEARRRFLDQGIVAARPALVEVLSRYRQALAQKRTLLREGRFSDLGTWNEVLAPLAAEIVRERARHVEELGREVQSMLAARPAAGVQPPRVSLRYRPSLPIAAEPTAEAALSAFERATPPERDRGAPLTGPQRDELELRWGDHRAAAVTSAGERKLFGLALHAARGHLLERAGRPPIYLLDDVDTELDAARLAFVWGFFSARSQLLATTNRRPVWTAIEHDRMWALEAGAAEPVARE